MEQLAQVLTEAVKAGVLPWLIRLAVFYLLLLVVKTIVDALKAVAMRNLIYKERELKVRALERVLDYQSRPSNPPVAQHWQEATSDIRTWGTT